MTIIDAPWGAGKTYFLQELIKYNINSKIKMNIFKKIIMIDVWKYAYSNNIPFQLLSEIYTKLVSIIEDNLNYLQENEIHKVSFIENRTKNNYISKIIFDNFFDESNNINILKTEEVNILLNKIINNI